MSDLQEAATQAKRVSKPVLTPLILAFSARACAGRPFDKWHLAG